MTEKIAISAQLRDSSVVEYVNRRLEEDDISKSELVREAFQKLAEADQERVESTSLVADNPHAAAREIDSVVVVEDADGNHVAVDLNDEDSPAYQDEDFALPLSQIPKYKELDPIGGQYSTGRDKPIKWAINAEELGKVSEERLHEIIEKAGGFSRTTIPGVFSKLVGEKAVYPHPSAPDGVLSDDLLTDIACSLEGYPEANDLSVLSEDKRKEKYADWSTLLKSSYGAFVQNVYYTSAERYLDALKDSIRTASLLTQQVVKSNNSTGTRNTTSGRERAYAWHKIAGALIDELDSWIDGRDYAREIAVLRQVAGKGTRTRGSEKKTGIAVDGDEYKTGETLWTGDYSDIMWEGPQVDDKHEVSKEEFVDYASEAFDGLDDIIQELKQKVGGNVTGTTADMSVSKSDALDHFGWETLDGKTEDDIQSRFQELVKKTHPDQSDYDSAQEFSDVMDARDLLEDLLPEAAASEGTRSSAVADGGENIESP
jgi:hypothetical protein